MDPYGEKGYGRPESAWGSEGTSAAPPRVPRPSFAARAFRWTARLVVIFLFLQLGLWMFIGRKSLTHLAPDMIVDDVRSVAALAESVENDSRYSERVYIISYKLAEILGDERLYRLDSSLSRFNGVLMTEEDGTYIERVNRDECGDCLFVGIRHGINTPFVAKSFTSYTRSLMYTRMQGIEQRTHEREHVYVWVLGRWIPVSTSWLSS
ncbi:MAG: hypothetical protein GTN89_10485 [Acidobacteria bacterium]|nr:hypothetical protein [Acidobacteriota bacterium]NIM61912.1 hypothetical protein [Acidobacteriota bacterium]NIO59682.1 hypothetical protein [Acidobacteriota bacterium]NIQ30777.1 hypothetical protein [Acidobacteriota bacterium]NIQ85804.1 hypothetical protein [Acidobacteriota bacterium]